MQSCIGNTICRRNIICFWNTIESVQVSRTWNHFSFNANNEGSMKSIWKLFWDICLFRAGPEQVPSSRALLVLILATFVVFNSVIRCVPLQMGLLQSVFSSLFVLVAFTGALWLGLLFKGFGNRFQQTAIALIGQDLVLSVLSLPLLLLMASQMQQGNSVLEIGSFILLLFYGWDLAAKGFIIRESLDVGPGLAFMFAFTLVMGTILLESQLFGLGGDSMSDELLQGSSAPEIEYYEGTP